MNHVYVSLLEDIYHGRLGVKPLRERASRGRHQCEPGKCDMYGGPEWIYPLQLAAGVTSGGVYICTSSGNVHYCFDASCLYISDETDARICRLTGERHPPRFVASFDHMPSLVQCKPSVSVRAVGRLASSGASTSRRKCRVGRLARLGDAVIKEERKEVATETLKSLVGVDAFYRLTPAQLHALIQVCEDMWEIVVSSTTFRNNVHACKFNTHCVVVWYMAKRRFTMTSRGGRVLLEASPLLCRILPSRSSRFKSAHQQNITHAEGRFLSFIATCPDNVLDAVIQRRDANVLP